MLITNAKDEGNLRCFNNQTLEKVLITEREGPHVQDSQSSISAGSIGGTTVETVPAEPKHTRASQDKDGVVGDEALAVTEKTGAQLQRKEKTIRLHSKNSIFRRIVSFLLNATFRKTY